MTFKHPIVNEIVVEGAGTTEFNGIYKRDGERNGFPSFVKRGRWQGGVEKFVISTQYGRSWHISIPSFGSRYYSSTPTDPKGYQAEDTPPETGWLTFAGKGPAPTLSLWL